MRHCECMTDAAQTAIARSISHTEIVHLEADTATLAALRHGSEGESETGEGEIDLWGSQDGDEWRVIWGPEISVNLQYRDDGDGFCAVLDENGGAWFPSESARLLIARSSDPETVALRMCSSDPMRGEWRS